MHTLSTLLLDFDGTIIESTPKHTEAIVRAFFDFLPEARVDADERKAYIGVDYSICISQMLAQRGIDDESLVQKITDRAVEHYQALHNTILCVPGAEAFIRDAHAHGLTLGVVSGSPHLVIEDTMEKLGLHHHFTTFVGREDVSAYKPHPDPYMRAMDILGALPEETIAFEDSPSGVESAWLASIPTVGILTSFDADDLHKTVLTMRDYTKFSLQDLHQVHNERRD